MQDKNSRWCFTSWKRPKCRKEELIQFEVWQREFVDSHKDSKIHFQGYVEFEKPYTRTQVKKLYSDKGMHLEEPRQSREVNMFYCLKSDTYYGERYMYQKGTPPLYFTSPLIKLD